MTTTIDAVRSMGLKGLVSAVRARLASGGGDIGAVPSWTAAVGLILAALSIPVLAIVYLALTPAENVWPHLLETVLPDALRSTLTVAVGSALSTLMIGTGAAWLVTMYRFPGRALLDRLLVLPLAMPAYIVAYCYADMLDFAGPLQTGLRHLMGWQRASDYWFPAIRSEAGAILIFSSVLYPYVYLAARATFIQQSVCALEVARTLGRTPMGVFWSVALPLARPALAAGVSLVLMETLNDLGAVQYLGVQTLSVSIYSTWLQRSNLGGAAQLATVLLAFVVVIMALERMLRGGAKVHHTTGRYRAIPFQDLDGALGWLAAAACLIPVTLGFVIPVLTLVKSATTHTTAALDGGFVRAAWNSLLLASLAAAIAVSLALVIAYARRTAANGVTRSAARIAGMGYALPGTVLAIGLLAPLASFDALIAAAVKWISGLDTGLVISGSIAALVYAYVIRFLAVALTGIEAGLERVSPNIDAVARALGATRLSSLWRVHLPLIVPALGSAGLLVFVDALKELPATLLLRPFNFETLATHVYGFAALEQVEGGALGALTIVAAGLLPVIGLHHAISRGRAGQRSS